jgi:hypothetical protein
MITEPVRQIQSAVEQHFEIAYQARSLWNLGIFNCRKIAGSSSWSQHAWGNAYDIGVKNLLMGDQVQSYLIQQRQSKRLPIGLILWRVPDHFDHVHVEGIPKMMGTPPCSRGDEMAILTDAEQRELQKFLAHIDAMDSNVGFVTQAIADVRERNSKGPWAPADHSHPGGGNPDHHHTTGPPQT